MYKVIPLVFTFYCWSLVLVSTHYSQADYCGKSQGFANHRQQGRLGSLFYSFFKFPSQLQNYRQPKIIDGSVSKKDSWPWQVSVELKLPSLGYVGHWCGGVLIHPSWILTAAHCVQNKLIRQASGSAEWTAVFGSEDRSRREIELPITDIRIHPNFANYQNDIAMLKIPWEPRLMNFAKPVCLPDQGKRFLGINCVATGWGQIEKHGQLQDQLRQVQLSVIENSHCQDMYHMKYDIDISNETHLCAGPILAGGKGTCVGDSGGPLQCNMEDGRWYLAGITSFGSGCAKPGFPDVFTRLTPYVDWIQSNFH